MITLLLVNFLAGIVTVFSPCVLPVLPILLSTSSGGGRLRPLSVVLGFIASFTVITLLFTAAAEALALPHQWLRVIAIVALGVFGLVLLVPALGRLSERALSPLTRIANGSTTRRGGIGGGLLLGSGLGLLWAPCAGPVMATVIVLTATQGISAQSVGLTLAYSLGAGIPMLAIGYGARGLVARARKFGPRAAIVQRAFGGLAVLTCLALLMGWDSQIYTFALRNLPPEWNAALTSFERAGSVEKELVTLEGGSSAANLPAAVQPTPPPTPPPTAKPALALDDLGPAPELTGITEWLNSAPIALSQLRGKVVIIDFWTFSCYNCKNTRPHVRALYDKYKDQGLEIIGVHTPEFAYEKVPQNILDAAKEQGVNWPIALDPDFKTWRAYSNRYWPAFYFIDAKGRLRYKHFGEGNYEKNDQVVAQLLSEAEAIASQPGNVASQPAPPAQEPTLPPPTAIPTIASIAPTQEPTLVPTQEPTAVPPTPKPAIVLEDRGAAPELVGITRWINSEPMTLEKLRGKVVIIDFWTFGCYNCKNTRPHVRALYDKYKDQGLEIIGVHTPEFAFEKVAENVKSAAKEQGVNWPIALDPDFKTWRAYSNRYWPAFYFVDAKGRLRYSHFGEGNYEYNEKVVQQLLFEAKASSK